MKTIFTSLLCFVNALCINQVHAQWQKMSSFVVNYGVSCILVDGNHIFVGGGLNGVILSSDNGNHWAPANNGLTSYYVHSLAKIGGGIFAATENGVYKFDNLGSNWTLSMGGIEMSPVYSFAVSDSGVFAAHNGDGVILSTDGGSNWKSFWDWGLPYSNVKSLAISGSDIFAGTYQRGIFLSPITSSTGSWTAVNTGLPYQATTYAFIIIGNEIYIGTNYGVYLSTNNGSNWSNVSSGLPGSRTVPFDVFALFDLGGDSLLAGTANGVFLSTNTGMWKSMAEGMPDNTYVTAFARSANYIFAGSNAGIWRRSIYEFTGIEEMIEDKGFAIYPNPSNGKFNVNCNRDLVTIEVYNLLDEKLFNIANVKSGTIADIDLSNYGKGIYLFKIHSGKQSYTEKVIVQ